MNEFDVEEEKPHRKPMKRRAISKMKAVLVKGMIVNNKVEAMVPFEFALDEENCMIIWDSPKEAIDYAKDNLDYPVKTLLVGEGYGTTEVERIVMDTIIIS